MRGIKRFRQAIKNQQDFGNGEFRLTYHDAKEIAAEIEEELSRLSWAQGVPAPVDADGEVVPLTTKVMYDGCGKEVRIERFELIFGFATVWHAIKMSYGPGRLDDLHLHRPDSLERLEEDVRNAENGGACGYYGMKNKPCNEDCPAHEDLQTPCAAIVLKDALRRAKALAKRDAKEACHD